MRIIWMCAADLDCGRESLPAAARRFWGFKLIWDLIVLQEDVARRVFQQLLDALDYCHKRSIFHRYAEQTQNKRLDV